METYQGADLTIKTMLNLPKNPVLAGNLGHSATDHHLKVGKAERCAVPFLRLKLRVRC